MKKINKHFYFTLICLFLYILSSCSEKVELIGNFEDTAVVYGLLDQADSLHYIKINRAFIGPGNALEIAQIADSSYFTNVEATIYECLNGDTTRSWLLRDTILDNKDTNGVFYAPEQKVYYFKTKATTNGAIETSTNPQMTSLNPQAHYKINIVVNDGAFSVSGETELVHGITCSNGPNSNLNLKFADNPGEYTSTPITVSSTGNSYVLNTQLKIAFYEWENTTPPPEKSFFWNLGEADVQPSSSKVFTANGETFYNLMKSNCTENSSITKRTFKGVTIKITGGAEELYNYIAVNKPSSGLAQNKPSYTNLSVTNGKRVIGIFSSRQTVEKYYPFYTSIGGLQQTINRAIDKKSTRELCEGSITSVLYKFCSNHPGDINETDFNYCPN